MVEEKTLEQVARQQAAELRAARARAGLSQEKAAEVIGIPARLLREFEKGRSAIDPRQLACYVSRLEDFCMAVA